MSMITDVILKLLPETLQQKIRNRYYEIKISKIKEAEEEDLVIVSKLVNPGEHVLDIGSNFGLYCKFLSSYTGNQGKVLAFEPIKKTFLSLKNNLKYLNIRNVEVFNMALSDHDGEAVMQIPEYNNGGENLYEARIVTDDSVKNREKVKTAKLDTILPENFSFSFVKIDVEGHEMNVLKGAENSIIKNKPVMLIEINGGINDSNSNSKAIVDFLAKLNYKAFIRKENKLKEVVEKSDGFNFFFLTEEHVNRYSSVIVN